MTSRLYLDLDGTLLDVSWRLYNLFNELAPESHFTHEEYWRNKRRRITQAEMLSRFFNYDKKQLQDFKTRWMLEIETPERLKMDTPFLGVSAFLKERAKHQKLYLVTARQKPLYVVEQLKSFNWEGIFTKIIVTQQIDSKANLIRASLSPNKMDLMIGDTGEDIIAAKELGVRAFAVSSGFLDADILAEYKPEKVLASVIETPF